MDQDITRVLRAIEGGDEHATDDLLPLVYQELRRLANQKMRAERSSHTLQPTALVHEVFLRLVGGEEPQSWRGQAHFFSAAAEAMRRILIDSARKRKAEKRGGQFKRAPLDDVDATIDPDDSETLLALDEALDALEREDANLAKLVQLRYFAGMTVDQTAELMGTSPRTVKRNWAFARAWLKRKVQGD
ncbi:MAG: sigma-70 family RNA polymerase sigma factor [Planctomycetota bacterium]